MEPHRQSVKQGGGGAGWKDRLREDARRLVRERRQQTLQRHRASTSPISPGQLQSELAGDVRAAMHDLLLGMQLASPPPPAGGRGGTTSGPGGGSSDGVAGSGAVGSSSSSGEGPAAGDVDAFLADLEAQIVAEMLAELEQLEAYEAAGLAAAVAEREAMMAAAAGACSPSAAAPPAPGEPSGDALLCPVCMASFLLQRAGVVACPRGCLQLNLAAESLSLRDLRARLSQVYEEHAATGCAGTLAFRMEDLFGTRGLTSSCSAGCQHYRVVA